MFTPESSQAFWGEFSSTTGLYTFSTDHGATSAITDRNILNSGAAMAKDGPYTVAGLWDNGHYITNGSQVTVAPAFTDSGSLADATVGTAYSATVAASGNPIPTYTATGLPDGLSLNSTSRHDN
jgi:hypothetical protein